MIAHMEELYGRVGRVWVMDRGLASEKNVQFLRAGGRRYILGTAKNTLRKFERELRSEEHTSELQSQSNLVCRLLLEKKKNYIPAPRINGLMLPAGGHRPPLHDLQYCSGGNWMYHSRALPYADSSYSSYTSCQRAISM